MGSYAAHLPFAQTQRQRLGAHLVSDICTMYASFSSVKALEMVETSLICVDQ